MIICVVGQPASGKDIVADYIVEIYGFKKFSSADFIRRDMKKLGITTDRTSINTFVSDMRKKFGNEYPAREIVKSVEGNTVIAGFRNTAEVKVIQEKFRNHLKIIAVEAPIEDRYKRARGRGRIGDDISLERFIKEEETERSHHSGSHEVDRVIKMADITIINDGTKEDLFRKVDECLKTIR